MVIGSVVGGAGGFEGAVDASDIGTNNSGRLREGLSRLRVVAILVRLDKLEKFAEYHGSHLLLRLRLCRLVVSVQADLADIVRALTRHRFESSTLKPFSLAGCASFSAASAALWKVAASAM